MLDQLAPVAVVVMIAGCLFVAAILLHAAWTNDFLGFLPCKCAADWNRRLACLGRDRRSDALAAGVSAVYHGSAGRGPMVSREFSRSAPHSLPSAYIVGNAATANRRAGRPRWLRCDLRSLH